MISSQTKATVKCKKYGRDFNIQGVIFAEEGYLKLLNPQDLQLK